MKPRIVEIEALRGIAFFAVVLQHVIGAIYYLPNTNVSSVIFGTTLLGLIRFAVPLFVLITGIVLFYNYDTLDYKKFLSKRIKQVVVPYLIWTIFYYYWSNILFGTGAQSTVDQVIKILHLFVTGTALYHLWFMVLIIQFYIVFPIFRILLSKKRPFFVNLVVVLLSLLGNYLLLILYNKYNLSLTNPIAKLLWPFRDRLFISWSFFFILGGFIGLYIEQWKKFISKTKYIFIIVFVTSIYFVYEKIANLNHNATGNQYSFSAGVTTPLQSNIFLFIIISIVVVYLFSLFIVNKGAKFTSLLELFGKYSFGAYFVHAFILRIIIDDCFGLMKWANPIVTMLISFVLCTVASLAISIALNKIKSPFGELIIGKVR